MGAGRWGGQSGRALRGKRQRGFLRALFEDGNRVAIPDELRSGRCRLTRSDRPPRCPAPPARNSARKPDHQRRSTQQPDVGSCLLHKARKQLRILLVSQMPQLGNHSQVGTRQTRPEIARLRRGYRTIIGTGHQVQGRIECQNIPLQRSQIPVRHHRENTADMTGRLRQALVVNEVESGASGSGLLDQTIDQ